MKEFKIFNLKFGLMELIILGFLFAIPLQVQASYFNALKQNVVASTVNSSVIPLNATTYFNGTSESTLGVAGIQVNLIADKNAIVYVEQSMDNTWWDIIDTYTYYHANGGWSRTFQATASYYRVRIYNSESTNMTYMRLQTALCPIVEAVPRSLDQNGNFKVSIQDMFNHLGFEGKISPSGPLWTATPYRLVGTTFSPGTTLDGNFWLTSTANGGTVTQANAQLRLRSTSTGAASGSAIGYSVRSGRYVAGNANYFRALIAMDVPTATNTRRWGAFDANNGAFFMLDGVTPKVVTRKTGADIEVPNGSFNGELGSTLGSLGANLQTYEIYYNNGAVWFCIGGKLLHKVSATTTTWADTLNFPIRFENTNGAITTDLSMYVRSASIHRLGLASTAPIWKNQVDAIGATILKRGPGRLCRVIVNSWATGATCYIYDALSATNPIALIAPANSGNGYATQPFTLMYDLDFYTGLTFVTSGTINVTIVYE